MTRLYNLNAFDKITADRWNEEIDALYTKLTSLQSSMTEYTKGEAITSSVNDEAYSVAWNGTTDETPSLDNLYDELILRADKASPTFTGTVTLPTGTPSASTEAVHPDYLVDAAQTKVDSVTISPDIDPGSTSTDAVSTSFIQNNHFKRILYEQDQDFTVGTSSSAYSLMLTTSSWTQEYNGDILFLFAMSSNASGQGSWQNANDHHFRFEVKSGSTVVSTVQHDRLTLIEMNGIAQWGVLRGLVKDTIYTLEISCKAVSTGATMRDPRILLLALPWGKTVTRVDTPDFTA